MRSESRIRVGRKHQAKIPPLQRLRRPRQQGKSNKNLIDQSHSLPSADRSVTSSNSSVPVLLSFDGLQPSYCGDEGFTIPISPALWCRDAVVPCPLLRCFTADKKPPRPLLLPSPTKTRILKRTTRSTSSKRRRNAISPSQSIAAKRPRRRIAQTVDDDFVVWDSVAFESHPPREQQIQMIDLSSHSQPSRADVHPPPPPPPAARPSITAKPQSVHPSLPVPRPSRPIPRTVHLPTTIQPGKVTAWTQPRDQRAADFGQRSFHPATPYFDVTHITPPSTLPPPPPRALKVY